ncbi:MAG: hypothetical protein ABJA67_05665 [Chthonomonadales bacterium]
MNFRAMFSPASWKQNLLLVASIGAASALIGCGGGGGGGNPGGGGGPGTCGSAAGSGVTVVCGYVVPNGGVTGVNGVNVVLRSSTGVALRSGTTVHNSASNQDGFYKITVPSGATLFGVDFSGTTGYLTAYMAFAGSLYDQTRLANAGGPCIPALSVTSGQDNQIGTITVYADASTPPPPVFVCPR